MNAARPLPRATGPRDLPQDVFDAPALRQLDAAARDAIAACGRLFEVEPGAWIYREGDSSESFYVVVRGAIEVRATRRTERAQSVLRTARRGDTFGEEATLAGVPRRAAATAVERAQVAEIPIAVFRRVTGRQGGGRVAERERRYLHRAVTRDLIATCALGRELAEDDASALLDATQLAHFERGAPIYHAGDRADSVFVVLDGLVQLQVEDRGQVSVLAYLSRGDFFGDEKLHAPALRSTCAVAMGNTWCARVPHAVVRGIADRNPGLLAGLRRISQDRPGAGGAGEQLSATSTQHVFRDLYRLQVAKSLLVIDQDSCVRCGHCAWMCAQVHGVSRLVRRGDKVVASLESAGHARGPASLLLANSCQHCRNAACMIDCPTGAIGRDLGGEVFIRQTLCTGCGNCAKACPWQNIQLAPRPGQSPTLSPDIAVKCDLCRDYQAPACVKACPTESILRLDPARDIAEVGHVLGLGEARPENHHHNHHHNRHRIASGASARPLASAATAVGATLAIGGIGAGFALQRAEIWLPGSGLGLLAGILAGLLMLALIGYAVPKRLVGLWMRKRTRAPKSLALADEDAGDRPARSAIKPHRIAHVALGIAAVVCAVAHAGARMPASPAGALWLAFCLATALGGFGALAYRLLPARLARLERRGVLPEDLRGQRQALFDRLYAESTGTSELVKTIAGRILLPYARSPLGAVALLASGRSAAQERQRLRRRIEAILQDRGRDRLDGLEALIKTVVELRALPARRFLSAALRAWLPIHIIASAVALAMLGAHVLTAVLG